MVFLFLFILIAVAGAGLYFHPYLAFYNAQTAANSRNVEKLSEWVDYPDFNQNVKRQLDAQWNETSTAQISATPYAESVNPAGRARVHKMIAALATPEAVMGFVRGETDRIGSWSSETAKTPTAEDFKDPLADLGLNMESVTKVMDSVNDVLSRGEFRYEGLNSFVATIKTVNGKNLDLIYERKGIGWKLTGITLPAEPVRSSINGIAQSVLKDATAKARKASKNKKSKKGKSYSKGKSVKKMPAQVAKLTGGKKAYMANL